MAIHFLGWSSNAFSVFTIIGNRRVKGINIHREGLFARLKYNLPSTPPPFHCQGFLAVCTAEVLIGVLFDKVDIVLGFDGDNVFIGMISIGRDKLIFT